MPLSKLDIVMQLC